MTCPLCNDTGIVVTHNELSGCEGDREVCRRCYRLIPEEEREPVEPRRDEPAPAMTYADWTARL